LAKPETIIKQPVVALSQFNIFPRLPKRTQEKKKVNQAAEIGSSNSQPGSICGM
jgi:hypothetical protein